MADFTPEQIEQFREQFNKLNKELENLGGKAFKEMPKDVDDVVKGIKILSNEIYDIKNAFGSISQTLRNVISDLNGAGKVIGSINGSFSKLASLASKVQEHSSGINTLSVKELKTVQARAKAEIENLQNQKNNISEALRGLSETSKQYQILNNQRDEIEDGLKTEDSYIRRINKLLADQILKEEKINRNLGLTGLALKGISSQFQKLGVDSEILDNMNKKLRDLASGENKTTFKQFFKVINEGLMEAFKDPLFRFALGLKMVKSGINDLKKAFESWKEFDKTIIESARSLGMARNELKNYITTGVVNQDKFNEKFEDGYLGATQIAKSVQDMNSQLGLSVQFSQDATNEFAKMTGAMGLTAEEASKIYNLGLLTNTSLKDTNKSIANGIISAQKRTGVQVNERQVLQEIGKLSAGITAKFQQNPKALAEAVVQAKALGTTLDIIDKIGESLLNFESSIENQLKAQLLTGKQLNLEQARYAALTGDQVTLMNEISSQVGSLADFTHMNVIAQKSLAEAFGMSRDELADMLKKQEVFNRLGDVSKMSAKEQLELAKKRGISESDSLVVNLKQQAATETLAAAFDNIKMTLADLLDGPLKLVAETMSYIAKHAGLAYIALGAIVGLSLAKTIGGLVLMFSQLSFFSRANAASTTIQNTALIEQNALTAANVTQNEVLIALKTEQAAATQLQNVALAEQSVLLAENIAANTTLAGLKTEQSIASGIQATATTETTIAEAAQIPLNTTNVALKEGEALAAVTTASASSFGLGTVAIIAGIAAILGAVAGMALKPKKMAMGGMVMPTPGGTDVTVGEAGSPEVILPLNSPKVDKMLGINKPQIPMANYGITKEDFKETFNDMLNGILNRPQPAPTFVFEGNGAQLGKFIGGYAETGTAQNISTGYKVA